jgi:hypothetical protein
MFSEWYPSFKSCSLRSTIIPLTPEFIDYLEEDGMFIEDDVLPRPKEGRFDEDEEDWSEDIPEEESKVFCHYSHVREHLKPDFLNCSTKSKESLKNTKEK